MAYRGRFAPSPTGPLHLGSLFAAVVSFLQARCQQGAWLLRMDDLDPTRCQAEAADGILYSLEAHGLYWDEAVYYQSQQTASYQAKLEQLQQQGQVFWCQCSRKELNQHLIYPGTCRHHKQPKANCAIRFRLPEASSYFDDALQGRQVAWLSRDCGDVVIKRRDGFIAYQLATVIDDEQMGINQVVRGIDLLSSTFWQQTLAQALGFNAVKYAHFPILLAANQQKLSKQNRAPSLNNHKASHNLSQVLSLLGLKVPLDQPSQMLEQAISNWSLHYLHNRTHIKLP